MYYQNIGLQASLRLLNNEHGCYCLLVSFLSIKSIVFLNMLYWFSSLIHTYNATSRQKHGYICIHIYITFHLKLWTLQLRVSYILVYGIDGLSYSNKATIKSSTTIFWFILEPNEILRHKQFDDQNTEPK